MPATRRHDHRESGWFPGTPCARRSAPDRARLPVPSSNRPVRPAAGGRAPAGLRCAARSRSDRFRACRAAPRNRAAGRAPETAPRHRVPTRTASPTQQAASLQWRTLQAERPFRVEPRGRMVPYPVRWRKPAIRCLYAARVAGCARTSRCVPARPVRCGPGTRTGAGSGRRRRSGPRGGRVRRCGRPPPPGSGRHAGWCSGGVRSPAWCGPS